MAPTFLPYLACVFYVGVFMLTLMIFVPISFVPKYRLFAKKSIVNVLISLPSLISAALLAVLVFFLPAILLSWLTDNNYLTKSFGIIVSVCGLFLFLISTIIVWLYLWSLFRKVIFLKLENKSISAGLAQYKLLLPISFLGKGIIKFFTNNGVVKVSVILFGIPMCAVLCLLIYDEFSNSMFVKPTQTELVGNYHISDVTVDNFSPSTFKNFKLKLNHDSTFELTPTPNIEVCSKGKYEVDYKFDDNEITFRCSTYITSAHIDRHYNYYRIEFIIGDPDSGESIFFEKDK